MRGLRHQHLLRIAIIVLMALNVVPEALAAVPVCSYDFGSSKSVTVGSIAGAQATLRHSHDANIAHECVATRPDRQVVGELKHATPGDAVAILPVLSHPAFMLAARGPSPRGSPVARSAYLAQRSSVLLLI